MIKNLRPEKENKIKNVRNLFKLEKIKRIRRDYFEDYHKPVGVNKFSSNIYIECANNGNRYKIPSVEEHLDKIRPYLKDILK